MDPLSAVEDILGDVESWPTCIILDIFVVKPTTLSVQNVAAFMYGKRCSCGKSRGLFCCMYWYTVIMYRLL